MQNFYCCFTNEINKITISIYIEENLITWCELERCVNKEGGSTDTFLVFLPFGRKLHISYIYIFSTEICTYRIAQALGTFSYTDLFLFFLFAKGFYAFNYSLYYYYYCWCYDFFRFLFPSPCSASFGLVRFRRNFFLYLLCVLGLDIFLCMQDVTLSFYYYHFRIGCLSTALFY